MAASADKGKIAALAPIAIEVESGKSYWWCACGLSAKQPFCDGSHKGTAFVPQEYKADASRTVYFCTCKQTAKNPMCDGSHTRL